MQSAKKNLPGGYCDLIGGKSDLKGAVIGPFRGPAGSRGHLGIGRWKGQLFAHYPIGFEGRRCDVRTEAGHY